MVVTVAERGRDMRQSVSTAHGLDGLPCASLSGALLLSGRWIPACDGMFRDPHAESKRLPTMVSCRHGQSPPALFHDGTCLGSEQAQAHEDQPARHSHGHDKSNRAMATNEPLPLAPSPPSPH
jgi:hypothetical protein